MSRDIPKRRCEGSAARAQSRYSRLSCRISCGAGASYQISLRNPRSGSPCVAIRVAVAIEPPPEPAVSCNPDREDDRDDRIPHEQSNDCTDNGTRHQRRPHPIQRPKHVHSLPDLKRLMTPGLCRPPTSSSPAPSWSLPSASSLFSARLVSSSEGRLRRRPLALCGRSTTRPLVRE